MKKAGIYAATVLICTINLLAARTIYVDQQAAGSRFKSAGAAVVPTIQLAADLVLPGDRVLIADGEYREGVTLRNSGTPDNRIIVKALNKGKARVYGYFHIDGDYVTIQGLHIDGSYAYGGRAKTAVALATDGTIIRGKAAKVLGTTYTNVKGTAISCGSGSVVEGNYIYMCNAGISASTNCQILNNEVERLYDWGVNRDCDYSRFFGSNVLFRGNVFHNTSNSETGSAHVDCWQTFDNSTSANNVTIERNVCQDCHQGFMGEAEYKFNSYQIKFYNNTFKDCWSWGLCVQEIREIIALHNVFCNIGAHGIGISGSHSRDNVIKNNIFIDISEKTYYFPAGLGSVGDYNLIAPGNFNPPVPGAHDLLQVNPMLKDPANGDFHLLPGSPCIDAGTDAGVTKDLEDNLRPQGSAPDIGPYEADQIKPNAPSNLNATTDENSITLTWTAPTAASDGDLASSYLIKRDGTQAGTATSATFTDKYLAGGTEYAYEVYALDEMGNASANAATGSFTTTADTKGPEVEEVISQGLTRIHVVFTEAVDKTSAETAGNYSLSGGVTVQSATLKPDGVTVELVTAGQTKDQQYTLTVSGVKDTGGRTMTQVQKSFTAIFKFRDDFESGTLSRWTPSASSYWQVTTDGGDKSAYINGSAAAEVLRMNQSIGTFSFDCDIKGTGTSMQNVSIIFGYQDAQNQYFVNLAAIDHLRLNGIFKLVNSTETKLIGNSTLFTDKDNYQHIRITRDTGSGDISVYYGSSTNKIATVTDKTYTSGDIGIWSKASPAYFDNVEIVDYIRTDPFSSVTGVKSMVPVLLTGNTVKGLPNPVKLEVMLRSLPKTTRVSVFRADGTAVEPYQIQRNGLYLILIGSEETVSKVMILK